MRWSRRQIVVAVASIVGLLVAATPPVTAAVSPTDFSLSASPSSLSIAPGSLRDIRIRVKRGSKFKSPLVFAVQNPFAGLSADLSPVTSKGSTLSIGTDTDAISQIGKVRITATGGGISRVATISITITGKGTPQAVGLVPPVTVAATAPAPTSAPVPPSSVPATTPPAGLAPPKTAPLKTTPSTNPAPSPTTPPAATAPPVNNSELTDVIYAVPSESPRRLEFWVGINQGGGVLTPVKTNLVAPSRTYDWTVGDVNGDGFDDVIFQVYSGVDTCVVSYRIARRKSATEFSLPDKNVGFSASCFSYIEPSGILTQSYDGFAVGDINGDKRADIVALTGTRGYDSNGPQWAIDVGIGDGNAGSGDGTGGFSFRRVDIDPAAAPKYLRVLDNNGDGRAEIALFGLLAQSGALFSGWQTYAVNNSGTATFQTEVRGPEPQQVVVTDLNANGKQELFVKINSQAYVIMLLKGGAGPVAAPVGYLVGGGRLNDDATPDLLTFSFTTPGVFRIWASDGATPPALTRSEMLKVPNIEKAKTGQFG